MCFKNVTSRNFFHSAVVLGLITSLNATAFAMDCDFWGDFAVTAQKDYQAHVDAGTSNPIAQTRELLGYEFTEPDTMGRHYYGKILAAIESEVSGDELFKIGKDVCSSYPEGTFDPDSLE